MSAATKTTRKAKVRRIAFILVGWAASIGVIWVLAYFLDPISAFFIANFAISAGLFWIGRLAVRDHQVTIDELLRTVERWNQTVQLLQETERAAAQQAMIGVDAIGELTKHDPESALALAEKMKLASRLHEQRMREWVRDHPVHGEAENEPSE